MKFMYIILGGGTGALVRYLLSTFIQNSSNKIFPFGTLVVNLTGCFLIGFLFALSEKFTISSNIRLFLFVGLLGGYTTFSSFGLETFNLLKQLEYKYAIINFLLSNFLGLLLVFAGFALTKNLFKN